MRVFVCVPEDIFVGMTTVKNGDGSLSGLSALTAVAVFVPADWLDAPSSASLLRQSSWNRRTKGDVMAVYLGMIAQAVSLGS